MVMVSTLLYSHLIILDPTDSAATSQPELSNRSHSEEGKHEGIIHNGI